MSNNSNYLFNEYLSNLQVLIQEANFIHCGDFWKEYNYIPDFNKLYFIIDGDGWVKINDTEMYPTKNQIVLLPAGTNQSYSYINDNYYTKYWCHFTAKVGGVDLFNIIQLPYIITLNSQDKVQTLTNLFKELVESHKHQTLTSAFYEKALMLKIIAFFIENSTDKNISFCNDDSIEKLNNIIKYIDNHLENKLSNTELSNVIFMHPNYLIKFFKKHIGLSPQQYITNKRINRAKLLITTTDIPFSVIASTIGLDNPLYFSKIFKKNTGFTPSQFRNMKKQKQNGF